MSALEGRGAEALGRLDSAEGGFPGRLTPTVDFRAAADSRAESEVAVDRPGEAGGEARSARGRSPLSRERAPAAEGGGARACEDSRSSAAGREPGASITGRRNQADAQGGGSKHDAPRPPAPAAPPVSVLQARVDTLHLKYRGEIDGVVRERLTTALARARELGVSGVAFDVGGTEMRLSVKSHERWWLLENRDLAVTYQASDHVKGLRLKVEVRAMTLAVIGAEAATDLARRIAESMLHLVEEERVVRIDLCADVTGFDLDTIDLRQWVTTGRAKAKQLDAAPDSLAQFRDGGTRTAFYVGRSMIMLRCYDKTNELHTDVTGEKRSFEHATWRAAGWDGTARVTRIEFQVRGKVMKELDDGLLRNAYTFVARLDALWKYLTYHWVRLAVLDSASRRGNWRPDPRWTVVRRVSFFETTGEVAQRRRIRGTPSGKLVAGVAVNFAAKKGMLAKMDLPSESVIARWSTAECEEFVRTSYESVLHVASLEVAQSLLASLGPAHAARVVAERLAAARAHAATVAGQDVEGHGLSNLVGCAAVDDAAWP